MMIIFVVVIGVLIYYLMLGNGSRNIPALKRRSAEDILRERFANGEIDEETFKQMIKTLNQ